jgi:Eukaryotic translation initiation factor 3 subunit G
MVSCRICKGDHWTTKCPYKDSLGVQASAEAQEADKKKEEPAASSGPQAAAGGRQLGKYVPPSLREGGNRKGESMSAMRTRGLYSTGSGSNFTQLVTVFISACVEFTARWMNMASLMLS